VPAASPANTANAIRLTRCFIDASAFLAFRCRRSGKSILGYIPRPNKRRRNRSLHYPPR
jgi:hypothetical protein